MDIYKQLISSVSAQLKKANFSKKGESFILKSANNRGMINFQKSRNSSINNILFTINVGVYLNSLAIFDYIDMLDKPIIDGCHWKKRIAPDVIQIKSDWWQVNPNTSFDDINNKIIDVLNEFAVPQIEKYIIDKNLEKAWLSGLSGGLTNQARQLYLITLLKSEGVENWQSLVDELLEFSKGKSFENNIKENLEKIGIKR